MRPKIMLLALLAGLLLLTACDTTVTQYARNHEFGLGETIEIMDDSDGELVGTLVITGIELLRNEAFEAQERIVATEEGQDQPQYETLTYQQIVQVFYVFEGNRRILGSHFAVLDQSGQRGARTSSLDPRPEYQERMQGGQASVVFALQTESRYADIQFRYSMWQLRPTATIRVVVPETVSDAPVLVTPPPPNFPPAHFENDDCC